MKYTEELIALVEQAKIVLRILQVTCTEKALNAVLDFLSKTPLEKWTKPLLDELQLELSELACPVAC